MDSGETYGELAVDTLAEATEEVPAPPPPDPEAWGPYGVGVTSFQWTDDSRDGRKVPALVYYPAKGPPVDAMKPAVPVTEPFGWDIVGLPALYAVEAAPGEPADGPYPIVAFSHGSGSQKEMYKFLLEYLASHGYVVLAVDHVGNVGLGEYLPSDNTMTLQRLRDLPFGLARLEEAGAPGAVLAGLPDPARVAFLGHSYGGHTALGLAGATYDFDGIDQDCRKPNPIDDYACVVAAEKEAVTALQAAQRARVKAVVSLAHDASDIHFGAGCAGAKDLPVPSLYLAGTADSIAPADANAVACHAMSPAPTVLRVFPDGGHLGFSDVGNEGPLAPEEMFAQVRTATVAFLGRHLSGRVEYDAYLAGDGRAAGVPSR